MASNFAFSMRSIMRKNLPPSFTARTHLDPANEHAVTTAVSLLLCIPFALYFHKPAEMVATLKTLGAPFYVNRCDICI
jgi:hypothetical protein